MLKTKLIIISILCLCLSGCVQIIAHKDPNSINVKINTLLKDIEFDKLWYGDFAMDRYVGESKDVKVITPYGVVESGGGE